jgi:histidine triad (HIT) family protein
MSYDTNNIFARILRGELPCINVYEDDNVLAFMDVMPQADGHTLIIPKEPARNLMELSDSAAEHLITKVKMIAKAVKTAMTSDGITVFQLNGAAVGQTVDHIHFHVLPASILNSSPHASVSSQQEHLVQIAERIKSAL